MKQISLGILFKIINNIFDTNANKIFSEMNITRSQMDVLVFIHLNSKKNIEVNQIDIQKHFNLTNPTVTGILNRLEEKELLIRKISLKGAKFKKIELTENGINLLKNGKSKAIENEKEVFGVLNLDEQKKLKELLQKVLNNTNMSIN